MNRPEATEYFPYVGKYITNVPDGSLLEHLLAQHRSTLQLLESITEEQGDYRYAEGKWSLKEVIGHVIDNERVWAYRLLRIARGDAKELPGYDQDIVAAHAPFHSYTLAELREEYDLVRRSTIPLLRHMPEEAWLRQGEFAGHPLSVRAAAYVICGHERYHIEVIKERYLNE